ncbi:MAG: signal peptidase II [Alphaproteobacteria bacterium]
MRLNLTPLDRKLVAYALVYALCVLVADQYTKWMILNVIMQPPQSVPVMPMLSFDLQWNRGVTFGMLYNHNEYMPYLFALLALAIIGWLLAWLWRTQNKMVGLGIGIIIGGAIGNVIDRLRFGAVVDFIHVSFYPWVFNVADGAVVIGVGLLLLDSFLERRPRV